LLLGIGLRIGTGLVALVIGLIGLVFYFVTGVKP
jgi:hypothetical protein